MRIGGNVKGRKEAKVMKQMKRSFRMEQNAILCGIIDECIYFSRLNAKSKLIATKSITKQNLDHVNIRNAS